MRLEAGFLASAKIFHSHRSNKHLSLILFHHTIPFTMLKGNFQYTLRMVVNYMRYVSGIHRDSKRCRSEIKYAMMGQLVAWDQIGGNHQTIWGALWATL